MWVPSRHATLIGQRESHRVAAIVVARRECPHEHGGLPRQVLGKLAEFVRPSDEIDGDLELVVV